MSIRSLSIDSVSWTTSLSLSWQKNEFQNNILLINFFSWFSVFQLIAVLKPWQSRQLRRRDRSAASLATCSCPAPPASRVLLSLFSSESESGGISIFPPACSLFSPASPNSEQPVCHLAFSEGVELCQSGCQSVVNVRKKFYSFHHFFHDSCKHHQFMHRAPFLHTAKCLHTRALFLHIEYFVGGKDHRPAHSPLPPSASLLPAKPPRSPSVDIVLVKMNANMLSPQKCILYGIWKFTNIWTRPSKQNQWQLAFKAVFVSANSACRSVTCRSIKWGRRNKHKMRETLKTSHQKGESLKVWKHGKWGRHKEGWKETQRHTSFKQPRTIILK